MFTKAFDKAEIDILPLEQEVIIAAMEEPMLAYQAMQWFLKTHPLDHHRIVNSLKNTHPDF